MYYLTQHIDKLITVCILLAYSIGVRFLLQVLGQRWVTTTAHTATVVLLPLFTFIITKVISGNIALSLGMVGALSIVRFRHPVRSPLELSVYFGAVTMGIAASVGTVWLLLLGGAVILAVGVLLLLQYLSQTVLRKPFFTTSFAEGNSLSTLDLTASEGIDNLDVSDLLKVKSSDEDSVHYVLTSGNFKDLQNILDSYKDDQRIQSYQLNR